MQHPDPSKIRDAMALLSEYEEGRRTTLHMGVPTARKSSHCGTVACFGGHFHIAQRRRRRKKVKWSDAFIYGAVDFTRHIFGDPPRTDRLSGWAEENPGLWGNYRGQDMFHSRRAYCSEGFRATVTLRDVIDHWIGVADRIEAHNATS